MKKAISTTKAPAAIGPYSQAIKVGNLVYTSGQIPIDPATGNFSSLIIFHRMRVISSPSISTMGVVILIFSILID